MIHDGNKQVNIERWSRCATREFPHTFKRYDNENEEQQTKEYAN